MDLLTMYPAKLGSPQTILASNLAADATAMVVSDASVLPEAPNIAVIGTDENCEIISYSAIDSSTNTVTISARGLGDSTAKAWSSGTTVARNHSSLDHNTLMANIASLNTGKAEAIHTHDDRYYTESEMDTALAGKQDVLNLPLQTNLGGTGGTDTGWLEISNSSVFIGMINYRKIGKFLTLNAYNITLKAPLSGSGSISDLCTLPAGFSPIHNAYGFCFSPNLASPAFIILYPTGIVRFSCGANSGWNESKTISFYMSVITD